MQFSSRHSGRSFAQMKRFRITDCKGAAKLAQLISVVLVPGYTQITVTRERSKH